MSLFARMSTSAVREPTCPAGLSACVWAVSSSWVSGNSPGRNSRPRSSRQTSWPARASREAAMAPP